MGAFVGASFALLRMALSQHKHSTDRFVAFLHDSLRRHEETIAGFRESIEALAQGLQEHNVLLRRLAERGEEAAK
jgi:hypothetical protein